MVQTIFITGGTGYIGQRLIPALVGRGHRVRALVRPGSARKLPAGVTAISGNPLDRATFEREIEPARTFVQLVGVPHPSPAKAKAFREIDLVSVRESAHAAAGAGIDHFIYVSVAQPAPIMRAYVAVRAEAESIIRAWGLNATFLRPLYVLGPGHRWPYLLLPIYWLFERSPRHRKSATRLGLVTLKQMLAALVDAVEHPPTGVRVVEVPQIRKGRMADGRGPAA
jgi:uncharacterized protein YbjT (DUF2867 family)